MDIFLIAQALSSSVGRGSACTCVNLAAVVGNVLHALTRYTAVFFMQCDFRA